MQGYYPFGGTFQSYSQSRDGGKNLYTFGYKELQPETGTLDFEARFYDPYLARWTVTDPLASYEPSWSPYRYAFNNPIRYIDPSGEIEIDQIQSIFDNAPSGASSYDGNGNCTCGCEGKPPCEASTGTATKEKVGTEFGEKVLQELFNNGPKISSATLGGIATFVVAMLSSHDAGEGSSKWSAEDQRLLDKLRFAESQGTLTGQQKRDLEELRGRFEESGLNAPIISPPTAQEIIAKSKKGSILDEFPEEFLNKTLDEIKKAAAGKGNKAAKKAKKLITDKRFDKKDNRK